MYRNEKLLIGKNDKKEVNLLLNMANRHGLITGASGSGKTITLKVFAESFSDAGVPVFLVDVKGDLAGMAFKGEDSENIRNRVAKLGLEDFELKSYPTTYYDVYGRNGHPIRATVSSIGPRLLSRMLDLTDTQEEVLGVIFKIAEVEKLDLVDLNDLDSVITYVNDKRSEYSNKYGNISPQSITSIKRAVLNLSDAGGNMFFGKPSFDIKDFMKYDAETGRGYINILDAQSLFKSPTTYVILILWLLNTIFTNLDEVGDLDKPKLVFFFDEAHLLFNGMPSYRLKQITQVVKLIRSRGIGLYFVSQSPSDIPDEISAQLGNRIQHTLRAYTPAEQRNVKAAADSLRTNPKFNTAEAILALGTGEALISFQNEKGEPEIVEKATILPPQSKMGTLDEMSQNKIINSSPLCGKYDEAVEDESAYEIINLKIEEEEKAKADAAKAKEDEKLAKEVAKKEAAEQKAKEKEEREAERAKKNSPGYRLRKKIVNSTENKLINKGLNAILKKIFK